MLKKFFYLSFRVFIFFYYLFFVNFHLSASAIRVSPVRVEFEKEEKVSGFELSNPSSEDLLAQIQVVQWTYEAGKDVHTPTTDLVITPPLVKIPAQGKQLVRLGLIKPVDPEKGGIYRVIIKQIPQLQSIKKSGVGTLLEIRMAAFVPPLIEKKTFDRFFS